MLAAALLVAISGAVLAGQRGIGAGPGRPVGGDPAALARGLASVDWRGALAQAADLRWFCVYLANGDRDVRHGTDHAEVRAITLINQMFANALTPEQRRFAILSLARIGSNMTEVAGTFPRLMLENADPVVRLTAADAIGMSFDDLPRDPIYGVSVMPPWIPELHAEQARYLLEMRLRVEPNSAAAAAMLRSMARLPMDPARAAAVETTLAMNLNGKAVRAAGAVAGLEILARRAPKRPFAHETVRQLQRLAEGDLLTLTLEGGGLDVVEMLASLRRTALLALHEANNDSAATLMTALNDADWQVRRLAATYLPARDDDAASRLEHALEDDVFQVRAAALTALAPWMRVTLSCGRLMSALDDPSPAVVMTAIDVAPANCSEHEALLMWLRQRATALGGAVSSWHVPAHALMALVRFKDPTAASINGGYAATHSAWEVRQIAATMAETLKDEPTAALLADDRQPNVRAAALKALTVMDSAKRTTLAINELTRGATSNGPALLAAAAALPDTMPVEDARRALERALNTASQNAPGTRDVRLGLIAGLRRFSLGDSRQLRDLLSDQDPRVAEAAAAVLASYTRLPVRAQPRLRAPRALSLVTSTLQRFATLELSDGGVIKIELLVDDAPLTAIAWYGRWSQPSHEAFIEVSPGVGARTGGVYDNAVDGSTSWLRDELGPAKHTRGAVAMMNNGHDLGNGQIFIDLVDRPDLDHGYTVFARIVTGLDVADRILPGVEIRRVIFSTR